MSNAHDRAKKKAEYYQKNKHRLNERNKINARKNREHISKQKAEYYKKNSAKIRKRHTAYRKKMHNKKLQEKLAGSMDL